MVDNTTILANAFLEASTDYQQRVPDVTQHGIAQVSEFLFKPMNKKYLNEFLSIFVNRIAGEVVHQREFRNPIKRKREDILFGTTIQEIGLDFIKAHAFKDDWGHRVDDITNLLKVYRPDGQVAYHSVNRYDQYPISINRMELRAAFTGDYGLNQLASAIMQVPYNSAEYDEYGIYKQLIAEHEYRHGFYKHQCAYPVDESTGKVFLRALRAYADKITVPTRLYNANDASIPVWVNRDELPSMVLYIEADAKASLDVDTLSSVFQLDKAEIKYRIQFIDSIPIPGAFALLTTDDFWMCADYDVSNDSFYNPQTKTETWYYTVVGMYSTSPFVPAILFTTEAGTVNATVEQAVTGLTITPATANVVPGGQIALVTNLTGTLTADPATFLVPPTLEVAPDACLYDLSASITSAGETSDVQLGIDTYVDRFGILHVGTTVPVGAVITVTATSTYEPVEGARETATGTYTVVAPS
jgi:hypothetical protein